MEKQIEFVKKATGVEIGAIRRYTDAHGYDINASLRSGVPMSRLNQQAVEVLDDMFERVPPLRTSITVWRDMDIELDKDFISASFVSSTTDNDQLESLDPEAEIVCCQYQIKVPAGTKILPLKKWSVNRNENEILLPRDSAYRYIKREVKRGVIWIYLELIPGSEPEAQAIKVGMNAHEQEVAAAAAYFINRLQQGEIQEDLELENELFDEDEQTSLHDFVSLQVKSAFPKIHKEVMELIDVVNYSNN